MGKIVLLEDEHDMREEVAAFLQKRGRTVRQAATIAEFKAVMGEASIAIIDVKLPDGDGIEAAEQLRRQDRNCGIIMLTARGAIEDKLKALQGGADHYLVKPIRLMELDAIVEALSRRVVKGWRVMVQARKLAGPEGTELSLSSLEISLCELLARHSGKPVSRRAIVEAFGFDWLDYDQRRLDTLVSRLRQRWRNAIGTELPLKTEHREGYSFAAPISLA